MGVTKMGIDWAIIVSDINVIPLRKNSDFTINLLIILNPYLQDILKNNFLLLIK
tara:strand:- start:1613 stop:1774 length:162 start_codon:yes stop_codon:yes gene_type:complete